MAKKLYVWSNRNVLLEYSEGLAVALAESEQEARETLLADITINMPKHCGTKAQDTWDVCFGLSVPADVVIEPVTLKNTYRVWLEGSS